MMQLPLAIPVLPMELFMGFEWTTVPREQITLDKAVRAKARLDALRQPEAGRIYIDPDGEMLCLIDLEET